MNKPEDRAWQHFAEEFDLPPEARPHLEKTFAFQHRVAAIAFTDAWDAFKASIVATPLVRGIRRLLGVR